MRPDIRYPALTVPDIRYPALTVPDIRYPALTVPGIRYPAYGLASYLASRISGKSSTGTGKRSSPNNDSTVPVPVLVYRYLFMLRSYRNMKIKKINNHLGYELPVNHKKFFVPYRYCMIKTKWIFSLNVNFIF
jgi:hypothetical protein